MRRRESLALIGSALLVPSCTARSGGALRVGSTNSVEDTTVAEIYAIALERAGIAVERDMHIGAEHDAFAALLRGDIDLYPAHTPERKHRDLLWLRPAPAIEAQCLAASQYSAEKYWLLSVSTCSSIANRLRLAATADFIAPGGPLDRLRNAYGGLQFKNIIVCAPGAQYYPLNRGEADVASAFTTDAAIVETQLVILEDGKHVLPRARIAPVIRAAAARAHPQGAGALNRVSATLTGDALREMNRRRRLLDMSAREVAQDFIGRLGAGSQVPGKE